MKLTFWGVRGSIATGGPAFAGFGGNTTCLELEAAGERLIFDAGTGIRALGDHLGREAGGRPVRAALFFTHLHWDHIQGFPFFAPAFSPETELSLFGPTDETGTHTVETALTEQMQGPNFPVPLAAMRSARRFTTICSGDGHELGPFTVRTRALQHPQGVLGYRVEAGGRSLCFATDTEHPSDGSVDEALLDLAQDVDLLIYDAQYTPEEYDGRAGPPRRGWGHSTYEAAIRTARAAGAKRLALFHHDPTHDDRFVANIEARAQAKFPSSFAAREGRPLEV